MEHIYNKLVRNKIPKIIGRNGEKPVTRVLSDEEYKIELKKTLLEECIEELADMLEVLISLAKVEDRTLEDIIEIANKKKEKRGGFDKKIFLEKVI